MGGLFFIAMAVILGVMSKAFRRLPNQKNVKGIVVAVEYKKTTNRSKNRYVGYVEYVVNNKVYSIISSYSSANMRVGQYVTISYDKSNPESAITRPPMFIYLMLVLLIIMGIYVIIQSVIGM